MVPANNSPTSFRCSRLSVNPAHPWSITWLFANDTILIPLAFSASGSSTGTSNRNAFVPCEFSGATGVSRFTNPKSAPSNTSDTSLNCAAHPCSPSPAAAAACFTASCGITSPATAKLTCARSWGYGVTTAACCRPCSAGIRDCRNQRRTHREERNHPGQPLRALGRPASEPRAASYPDRFFFDRPVHRSHRPVAFRDSTAEWSEFRIQLQRKCAAKSRCGSESGAQMVTPERCHPLSRLSLTRTGSVTAVRQLLCPEAVKAKWIFP